MLINQPLPLSLYIHLPWCVQKCPYCDFNSHVLQNNLPAQEYINALLADLTTDLPKIAGRNITSIFFGGGTPSLFLPKQIKLLLEQIQNIVPLQTKSIEITLEANPGTLEHSYLTDYVHAGINRISLGAQSFQDDKLQVLGRIHNSKHIGMAIAKLAACKFTNFNIDLMFGLPGQTQADAIYDLRTALSFKPAHMSWYQLTLEPNTTFYKRPPHLPDDDACWQMQQAGNALLQEHNYQQYEISAFAQSIAQRCQHNLNYWQFGDYLGIGAGAHSKITNIEQGCIKRFTKVKNPKTYLAATSNSPSFIAEEIKLTPLQLPFEFMLNALRLTEGFSTDLFPSRTGLELNTIASMLKQAVAKGFITNENAQIQTTDLGKRFLNDVIQLFLRE